MTPDPAAAPGDLPDPSSAAATEHPPSDLDRIRSLLAHHTQQLLGDTISLSDEQWRADSALPGWSRGHVATHLARQADALTRLAGGARSRTSVSMYSSSEARDAEIEAGAGRTGLELQIDLDTAAGALAAEFEAVGTAGMWGEPVELRGRTAPVRLLPLGRLHEVVVHHVDLDLGYTFADVPVECAGWLLEWCAFRLTPAPGLRRLELVADDGTTTVIGDHDDLVTVSGPANLLLGWLTGRTDGDGLVGTDGVQPPAHG